MAGQGGVQTGAGAVILNSGGRGAGGLAHNNQQTGSDAVVQEAFGVAAAIPSPPAK